jgi:hypothetical protein
MRARRSAALPLAVAIAAAIPLGGCDEDPGPPPKGRGVGGPSNPPGTPPGTSEEDLTGGQVSPSRVVEGDGPPDRDRPTRVVTQTPPEAGTEQDGGEDRDLAGELRQSLGNPAGCLQGQSGELPDELTLNVSAVFVSTGRVTRAEVSHPALSRQANRCLRKHVEAVQLAAPIEDAPRTVRTSLQLERNSDD